MTLLAFDASERLMKNIYFKNLFLTHVDLWFTYTSSTEITFCLNFHSHFFLFFFLYCFEISNSFAKYSFRFNTQIFKKHKNIFFFSFYCYSRNGFKWKIWYGVTSQPHQMDIIFPDIIALHTVMWNLTWTLVFFSVVRYPFEIREIFKNIFRLLKVV